MEDLGDAGRARKGIVLAWRRRQVSLAALGLILCVAMANGDLKIGAGGAALAFSPDGTLLAMARGDGIASLSDVASGRQVGAVRVPSGSLHAVAFSEDGRVFATGGGDGAVCLWDVKTTLEGNR